MPEQTAAEPYVPGTVTLPDKNGERVHVGDVVLDSDGRCWRVTGLRPVEEHEPDSLYKKTGNLSLQHSHIDVEQIGDRAFIRDHIQGLNLASLTQASRSPESVEKLDSIKRAEFERLVLERKLDTIHWAQSHFEYERKRVMREIEKLKERSGG